MNKREEKFMASQISITSDENLTNQRKISFAVAVVSITSKESQKCKRSTSKSVVSAATEIRVLFLVVFFNKSVGFCFGAFAIIERHSGPLKFHRDKICSAKISLKKPSLVVRLLGSH